LQHAIFNDVARLGPHAFAVERRRRQTKDGVLQTWLMTSYSARKLGLTSTGHAGGIHNWRPHAFAVERRRRQTFQQVRLFVNRQPLWQDLLSHNSRTC
jgi:hypothetical protein